MKPRVTFVVFALVSGLALSSASMASIPTGTADRHPVLILQEGDVIPGTGDRVVDYLSGPVNAGGDHVGIIAVLSDGEEGALWVGHHRTGLADLILANEVGALQFAPCNFGVVAASGGDVSHEAQTMFAAMALMPDSQFALLTTWGVAQALGEWAPGLPDEASVTSINRVQMLLSGETYWVANWQGPGAWGNGLFQRDPGPWGRVELLLNSGDRVCGGELLNLRHFRVAEDRTLAQVVDLRTPQGDRTALLVGGECPYAVGQPLPASSERPTQFWFFDVNSSGHVLFGALTDMSAQRNAVFVLDGNVVMREGDVVDGIYLRPPYAEPNQVRLDDRGRAVTLWANVASSTFTIFLTPNIDRFTDTRQLVSENAPLDFDGDGDADATLYRFRFFPYSGPTLSLGETGIYIAVWLTYPGSNEAVAAVIFYPF